MGGLRRRDRLAARIVRRAAVGRVTVALLVACLATGVVGTLMGRVDGAQGFLDGVIMQKDTVNVYGLIAASVLAALLGCGVACVATVSVAFGAPWPAQQALAWLGGMASGVLGGVFVIVGVLAVGAARFGFDGAASAANGRYLEFVLRTLAMYAVAAAIGVAVGMIARRVPVAVAVLLLLQVPGLPVAYNLYSRSTTAQDALGLLPFGALRGLTTGNSGTYNGGMTGAYTTQSTTLLVGVLAAWFLVLWFLSGLFPGRSTRDPVWRRPTVLAPSVAVVAAVVVGGLAAHGVGEVPWRWTPQWRHATATDSNSRQVTDAWIRAVRGGDADEAAALVRPGHAQDVPPDVADVFAQATSYEIQPEKTMQDPDELVVELTYEPAIVSGDLVVDKAQVVVDLAYDRAASGWRLMMANYPALHLKDES